MAQPAPPVYLRGTVAADLPVNLTLSETNDPFTQIDGHPSEPVDMRFATAAIARARNLPVAGVTRAVRTHLQALLR